MASGCSPEGGFADAFAAWRAQPGFSFSAAAGPLPVEVANEVAEACRPVLEHFGQHPVPGLSTEEAFIRWWSLVFGFLLSAIDGMTGGIEESRELLARIWR